MTALTDISPGVAGLQTRLVIETITQVVSGAEIVEIVGSLDETIPGFEAESWSVPGSDHALVHIRKRVVSLLGAQSAVGSFSCVVSGVAWGVLVEPIALQDGDVIGALVVARQGRAWSSRERALTKAFGGLLSHTVTLASRESALLDQRRLDELVGQVAERLMSASSRSRDEVLTWTTRVLAEFLGADVAFLRRNDHQRGMSILEAEWPPRDIPDPDPLGEVPFDADPVFAATKNLRKPYLPGATYQPDEYKDRVNKGSGCRAGRGRLRAPPAGRHHLGRPGLLALGTAPVDPRGDQRPAGHRLHARPAPGPHRRRGADRVHRPPRRPDRAAQPSRPAPGAGGAPRRPPRDGDPLLRPRPLQGHERLLGSRQRRPGADHHRRPDPHQHPARTTSRPGSGATSS